MLGTVKEDYDERVRNARNAVFCSNRYRKPARGLLKKLVTDCVAVEVVYQLKSIKIHIGDRAVNATIHHCDRVPDPSLKTAAI